MGVQMGVQKGVQMGSKRGSSRGSRLRGPRFVPTPYREHGQTVHCFFQVPRNASAKTATTYSFDLEPRIPVSRFNSDFVCCDS